MKKQSVPLALTVLAAALSPHANAQNSSVSIYGHVYASVESVRATGATSRADGGSGLNVSSVQRLSSAPSILGFRGTEDLGGGLSAFFQMEGTVSVDTGNANLFNRDTGVGLQHATYGTIALGNFNAPMKYSSIRADPWASYTFASYTSIINTPGFGVGQQVMGTGGVNNTLSAFDVRMPNSIHYRSPKIAGFTTRLAVSAPESKGEVSVGSATVKPYAWGGTLIYESGNFWAAYAYEKHQDYFGLNNMSTNVASAFAAAPFATTNTGTRSSDYGHRISGGYTFGATTVSFMADRLVYSESGTTAANELTGYRRNAAYVSLVHRIGAGQIMAAYARAFSGECETVRPGCTVDDTGASMFAMGYHHFLSKRTRVGVQYAQVANERNGSYGFGNSPLPGAGAGATRRALGVVLQNTF